MGFRRGWGPGHRGTPEPARPDSGWQPSAQQAAARPSCGEPQSPRPESNWDNRASDARRQIPLPGRRALPEARSRRCAPGGTRTPITGSVIRHDLRFTTGAWYPRQEMSLRPPASRAGALPLSYAGMVGGTELFHGWHGEIRTPMTSLTGRRPAVERRAIAVGQSVAVVAGTGFEPAHNRVMSPAPYRTWLPRSSPTGTRTRFAEVKVPHLTHGRWGRTRTLGPSLGSRTQNSRVKSPVL
jgi:hypothetical protein